MLARCRLCSKKHCDSELRDIFNDNNGYRYLINKLLPVVVIQWDPLPHCVCLSCAEKLILFDNFYNDSLESENFLRKLLPFEVKYETNSFEPALKLSAFTQVFGHHLKHIITNIPQEEMLLADDPRLRPFEFTTDEEPHLTDNSSEVKVKNEVVEYETFVDDTKTEHEKDVVFPPTQLLKEKEEETKCPNGFVITRVNCKEFVYTCKRCSRTYTKESTAFSHSCETTDERRDDFGISEELNEINQKIGSGEPKVFPPFKIRLVTSADGYHTCQICSKSFSKKNSLQTHQRKHPDYNVDKLRKKLKKLKSRYTSKNRKQSKKRKKQQKVANNRNLRTLERENIFSSQQVEEENAGPVLVETQKESFKCSACNLEFHNESSYSNHSSEHFTEAVSRVGECSQYSDLNENVERKYLRKRKCHGAVNLSENKKLICVFCLNTYTHEDELIEHQKSHQKEVEKILTYSGFRVTKKKRKNICQMEEPIGELKNYQSSTEAMNTSFSSVDYSLSHPSSSKEYNENSYCCNNCSMLFTTKDAFTLHERSHYEECLTVETDTDGDEIEADNCLQRRGKT